MITFIKFIKANENTDTQDTMPEFLNDVAKILHTHTHTPHYVERGC